jgi:O-antigen ligase
MLISKHGNIAAAMRGLNPMRPRRFLPPDTTTMPQILLRITDGGLVAFALFAIVSISLMQAAYILAVVAWLVRLYLQGHNRQMRLPLLVPVCAFMIASLLATLTAVAPYQSLIELRNVLGIVLFYLVVNAVTAQRAITLTRVLIGAGTVMAVYGLTQSVTLGTGFRIHGSLGAYMTFANLLVLIDIVALTHVLFNRDAHQAWWLVLAVCVLTAALLMTQTRGSWLAFLAGVVVVVAARQQRLLLLLPPLLLLIFILVPHTVKERIYSIVDAQNATVQTRLCKWRLAWNLFQAYPWTGVGMNGIRWVYLDYKGPQDPIACGDRRLGHLDNNLIQIVVERGILGLVSWLAIWIVYLHQVYAIYRRLSPQGNQAKILVVSSLATIVAFHVAGSFEYTYGDEEVIAPIYFFMALPFLALPTPPPAAHRAMVA